MENEYQLFRSIYIKNNSENITKIMNTPNVSLEDIFDFKNSIQDTNIYICIHKSYKNENSICLTSKLNSANSIVYLVNKSKDFLDEYLQYYILYYLKTKMNTLVKGLTNIYDISLIKKLEIPALSIDIQQFIINHINCNNETINSNKMLINNYKILKHNIIKMNIQTNDNKYIMNITTLKNSNEMNEYVETISIIKNGLKTGHVDYIQNCSVYNTNSYYIVLNTQEYKLKYIYYILDYNNNNIFNISNLKEQPLFTQYIFTSLQIPNVNSSIQDLIINKCEMYDNMITNCNQNIQKLNNEIIVFLTQI